MHGRTPAALAHWPIFPPPPTCRSRDTRSYILQYLFYMLPLTMKPKTTGTGAGAGAGPAAWGRSRTRNAKYRAAALLHDRRSAGATDYYLDRPWKKLAVYLALVAIVGTMVVVVIRATRDTPVEYVLDV